VRSSRVVATVVVVSLVLLVAGGCSLGSSGEVSTATTAPPSGEVVVAVGGWETVMSERGSAGTRWLPLFFAQSPAGSSLFDLADRDATAATAIVDQVPRALELDPSVVTVWLVDGDVDSRTPLASYERDLGTVVQTLVDGGQEVLVTGGWQVRDDERAAAYREVAEQVATKAGVSYVDLADLEAGNDGTPAEIADRFAAARQ